MTKKTTKRKTREQLTAEANAAFAKMTPEQKRVQIAKDVLGQLDAKRIKARHNSWVIARKPDEGFKTTGPGQQVCEAIKAVPCQACAIGAVFVCAVERANALKVCDVDPWVTDGDFNLNNEERIFDYLRRFFSDEQIEIVETAFEAGDGFFTEFDEHADEATWLEAKRWGRSVRSAETRMRLIMKNIVMHNGDFNLAVKPAKRGNAWALR